MANGVDLDATVVGQDDPLRCEGDAELRGQKGKHFRFGVALNLRVTGGHFGQHLTDR